MESPGSESTTPPSVPKMTCQWNVQEWVAYAGLFPFPEGAAASRRVLGVSQSLALSNLKVVIAAGENYVPSRPVPLKSIDGIFHQGVGEYDKRWPSPRKVYQPLWKAGSNTLNWLSSQPTRPKSVAPQNTWHARGDQLYSLLQSFTVR